MRKRWLETLRRLAQADSSIVFIGSDLSADPALKKFRDEIGPRFFMEGISEAHVVSMAAGLAMSGKRVYVNTIATFLSRRCYEQIVVDVALANADVCLIAGGGGLVYAPLGPTHLAIDDLALLRAVPNMSVIVPADADEMERAMLATATHRGPIYLRAAKGGEPVVSRAEHGFEIGKAILHRPPGDALIISTGVLTHRAQQAADELARAGVTAGVLHVHTLKPLDEPGILGAIQGCRAVITLEEHIACGGLGSAVSELIAEQLPGRGPRFRRLCLPDQFPDEYGSQDSLLDRYGLNVENVVRTAKTLLG